jgi:hypothetical protein
MTWMSAESWRAAMPVCVCGQVTPWRRGKAPGRERSARTAGSTFRCDLAMSAPRTPTGGISVPLAELRGLPSNPSGEVAFTFEREAGAMSLRGRFEQRLGTGHLTFEENPGFRKQMASLGYADWTEEEVFLLFSTDVGPPRVEALRELGYSGIPKEKLIEVGLFDATPNVIRAYARVGYPNLPPRSGDQEEVVPQELPNRTIRSGGK